MPAASSNGSGPRYAPEDPTLPAPWKGLVDGSTGYLYYWNPVTNVTQYEKPVKDKIVGPPAPAKPASVSVSSSVHRGESYEEDGRSRSDQYQVGRPSGSSTRAHGSSDGGGLSTEAYRRKHEITIVGDDVPPPYMTFEQTSFPSEILREVQRAGFASPTPIQAQSWPIALQSRDIVAVAKTGSGKTLGYLLPGFIHLKRLNNNSRMGPTVLVLAPTRELATQIQDEAAKFGKSSGISCTCVYGGAPKGPQLRDLDRGVDVVVATPGRLNDILEMRRVNLRQVSYLVLDEADRMLDMGFEPQIRKIVKEIPARRQTLMYTATWPKEVRKIAADLLVHPAQVNIGNIDELVANKSITQYVEVIKPIEKQRRLEQILRSQERGSKVIIFCSTKRMCDQLARTLTRQFGAAAIHGDKNQTERDRVLGDFRTGNSPILVATDVAARGLDIKDIRVVINYDFPTGVEDYVHRIGRTGRAGATGVAYTFFSDQDSKYARELVKVLEGAGQRVPPELREMVSYGGYGGKSRRWASGGGGYDRGRSNGTGYGDSGYGGRGGDSGYGGRGGRGVASSERSNDDHGVYRSWHDSFTSYDRDRDNKERIDIDGRAHQESKPVSRTRNNSRSPSPKRGPSGWGWSRSRSRSRSRSVDRYGKSTENRPPPIRDQPSHRSPASYDDGEIRDDQLHRSEIPRDDPTPYVDNERREGSPSPISWHQKFQNPRPSSDEPVRPKRSANGGDEEEEGMIMPEEEEGMIHPDE